MEGGGCLRAMAEAVYDCLQGKHYTIMTVLAPSPNNLVFRLPKAPTGLCGGKK